LLACAPASRKQQDKDLKEEKERVGKMPESRIKGGKPDVVSFAYKNKP
jgi:hypothetical protein